MQFVFITKEMTERNSDRSLLSQAYATLEEAKRDADDWEKREGNKSKIIELYMPVEEYSKWKENYPGTFVPQTAIDEFMIKNEEAQKNSVARPSSLASSLSAVISSISSSTALTTSSISEVRSASIR